MERNWLLNPGPRVKRFEPMEALYQSLGRFVDLFASTEILLQHTLWHVCNISIPVAKAVFSGVKFDQATQHISRVFEVTGVSDEKRTFYQELFTHIGFISDARNLILHHGLSLEDNGVISTNSWWALTPARMKRLHITEDLLRELASDTIKANSLLQINLIADPEIRARIEEFSRDDWQRPWLYKPQQQPVDKSPRRSTAPKRQRRP